MKTIDVSVDTGNSAYLNELIEFQGDLKELSGESLDKLKKRIVDLGFTVPFFVWIDDGVYRILDGHQRKIALLSLKAEGWNIPKLPFVEIPAENEKNAREKLLSISSQFGDFNVDSLKLWMDELDSSVADTLRFVSEEITFDLDFDFGEDNSEEKPTKTTECPKCGHEW